MVLRALGVVGVIVLERSAGGRDRGRGPGADGWERRRWAKPSEIMPLTTAHWWSTVGVRETVCGRTSHVSRRSRRHGRGAVDQVDPTDASPWIDAETVRKAAWPRGGAVDLVA